MKVTKLVSHHNRENDGRPLNPLALKSPFPYFGGKSRAAHLIWDRFGDVANYVEPFAGSLAVLLLRPTAPQTETVNDADGLLANFWRSIKLSPAETADHADWPVNEADLHARHLWLIGHRESMTESLMSDPEWHDPKAAGWWVWGICQWIGGGWCRVRDMQIPHLGNAGRGVHRQRPHLGGDSGAAGAGIHASAFDRKTGGIFDYFQALSARLRHVRVCCGDWSRVTGPSVTHKHGITGVFLDPPYSAKRARELYAKDCLRVAADAREWAIAEGDNPLMRICVAGYEGEHQFPDNWQCVKWKPRGGFDGQNRDRDNNNRDLERLWFSPHCLKPMTLFA